MTWVLHPCCSWDWAVMRTTVNNQCDALIGVFKWKVMRVYVLHTWSSLIDWWVVPLRDLSITKSLYGLQLALSDDGIPWSLHGRFIMMVPRNATQCNAGYAAHGTQRTARNTRHTQSSQTRHHTSEQQATHLLKNNSASVPLLVGMIHLPVTTHRLATPLSTTPRSTTQLPFAHHPSLSLLEESTAMNPFV